MYADRYQPRRVNRGSLGLSVGIAGSLVAAAMLASPVVRHFHPVDPPLPIYTVPPVEPPPPDPQPRQAHLKSRPTIDLPVPKVPTEPKQPYVGPPHQPPVVDPGTGEGNGTAIVEPIKPPPPVLTQAAIDERYARDFQPIYPAGDRRAGAEGVVTIRVLIGVDGRVREAVRVGAPSDDFWRTTERQALAKWRFRPATRDGVPVEAWRTMTVRFTLEG